MTWTPTATARLTPTTRSTRRSIPPRPAPPICSTSASRCRTITSPTTSVFRRISKSTKRSASWHAPRGDRSPARHATAPPQMPADHPLSHRGKGDSMSRTAIHPIVRALGEDRSVPALLHGEKTRVLWSRRSGFKIRSLTLYPSGEAAPLSALVRTHVARSWRDALSRAPVIEAPHTVEAADCVAPPSRERVSCRQCGKTFCGGSVVSVKPHGGRPAWSTAFGCFYVPRLMYCDHCDHIQCWDQACDAEGILEDAVISARPDFITRHKDVAWHLRTWPQLRGVQQS